MNRKEIPCFCLLCLLLWGQAAWFSPALDKKIELGGKSGWPELASEQGITRGRGVFGYESIELQTNARRETPLTDLLLPFESETIADETGNYEVVSSQFQPSRVAVMGHEAALSIGRETGMELKGREGSIFGGGYVGSFSIEFWLYPSVGENGEEIIKWRSSRENDDGYLMYQTLDASFANNRMEWRFENLFNGYAQNDGAVVLSSVSNVIPEKWSHHNISFNGETGLLEYRIDGKSEAIVYLTDTGREGGSVYQFMTGLGADLLLAPEYSGAFDDFRVLRSAYGAESDEAYAVPGSYDIYNISGGRFETQPLKLKPGSVVKNIQALTSIPEQTDVRLYVRAGDNMFAWTENSPAWVPVKSDGSVSGVSGSYVQLAVNLYPDGAGLKTPSITSLTLNYTEIPSPLPPFTLYAEAGDGYVDLHWAPSADSYAEGYMVYYGERPGEYLGRVAAEGPSPIDAAAETSLRISGLTNGKMYYFAVVSYSKAGRDQIGEFSKEIYARPGLY